MPRAPIEILHGLQALMAELTAAMQEDGPRTTTDDISPKLQQALDTRHRDTSLDTSVSRHTRATMPSTADVPLESHEAIRAKARAYKPEFEQQERQRSPKDSYRQSYDPGFDEAVFMGTGDQQPD